MPNGITHHVLPGLRPIKCRLDRGRYRTRSRCRTRRRRLPRRQARLAFFVSRRGYPGASWRGGGACVGSPRRSRYFLRGVRNEQPRSLIMETMTVQEVSTKSNKETPSYGAHHFWHQQIGLWLARQALRVTGNACLAECVQDLPLILSRHLLIASDPIDQSEYQFEPSDKWLVWSGRDGSKSSHRELL